MMKGRASRGSPKGGTPKGGRLKDPKKRPVMTPSGSEKPRGEKAPSFMPENL